MCVCVCVSVCVCVCMCIYRERDGTVKKTVYDALNIDIQSVSVERMFYLHLLKRIQSKLKMSELLSKKTGTHNIDIGYTQ